MSDTAVADLAGSAWRLVQIGGEAPPDRTDVTLEFTPSGVSGFGGCNRFAGGYQLDPATGALSFGPIRSTRMACLDQARSDLETAFLAALDATTAAAIDLDGRLVLAGSTAGLIFLAAPSSGSAEPAE